MMEVRIPPYMVAKMLEWADEEEPNEAAGIFLGNPGYVREIQKLTNVHPEPHRAFAFDGMSTLAAYREAENKGLQVIGTWHSHPTQAPIPSNRDKEGLRHPHLIFHVVVGHCFITRQGWDKEEERSYTKLEEMVGMRDFRLYDREWEEIDHIDVPARPFLTLCGVAQPTGELTTSDDRRA